MDSKGVLLEEIVGSYFHVTEHWSAVETNLISID